LSEGKNKERDDMTVSLGLSYIETPRGNIPTYESVRELAKIMAEDINELIDITSNLEERLSKLEKSGGAGSEELREKLLALEESVKELREKLELELKDISDKLSVLTDAFAELVERIKKLEENLPKD